MRIQISLGTYFQLLQPIPILMQQIFILMRSSHIIACIQPPILQLRDHLVQHQPSRCLFLYS